MTSIVFVYGSGECDQLGNLLTSFRTWAGRRWLQSLEKASENSDVRYVVLSGTKGAYCKIGLWRHAHCCNCTVRRSLHLGQQWRRLPWSHWLRRQADACRFTHSHHWFIDRRLSFHLLLNNWVASLFLWTVQSKTQLICRTLWKERHAIRFVNHKHSEAVHGSNINFRK